ncbi:MAG: nuclear transport factor 2 family protein [Woeseia sp.]|jgi:ketosteroid isomerase-like protein|nr:nuclear transport factor 2 family protein [Woeseia sp.]MBT6209008.1 nuclear transport factor 2 family protein [Woeseia sp.]
MLRQLAITLSFFLALQAPALGQDGADDHAAVWASIEEIWDAQERGDADWVDAMLSADFMGWPDISPAPRSKASTRMWARFNADQSKGLAHELYPLSIVVHGDMAVVHYLYSTVIQAKSKTNESTTGRYTDVLVRDNGAWKFISWHGVADD